MCHSLDSDSPIHFRNAKPDGDVDAPVLAKISASFGLGTVTCALGTKGYQA